MRDIKTRESRAGSVKTIDRASMLSYRMKQATIKQLKAGEPVWFGCDVGKSSERENGMMMLDVYDKGDLFKTEFTMNKAERLDYGHSLMTHAMVFQGVNLDENGKPNRWRVENSWGKEPGKDGYYVMSDEWFDEYTYQIWDPMGSLA